jgi:hypothetical protein
MEILNHIGLKWYFMINNAYARCVLKISATTRNKVAFESILI